MTEKPTKDPHDQLKEQFSFSNKSFLLHQVRVYKESSHSWQILQIFQPMAHIRQTTEDQPIHTMTSICFFPFFF